MSLGAYPSTSILSSLTENTILPEHKKLDFSETKSWENSINKMKQLQDYHLHVDSLNFGDLKQDDLCFLYKNHINNTKIKLEIESLTDFIESCNSDTPHPQVLDSWKWRSQELKKDILSSVGDEINSLSIWKMSYRADSEFFMIYQSNEKIQSSIEKTYPGINISISVEFMNEYKNVYIRFRDHLRDSLSLEMKQAEKTGKPDPFKEEIDKFLSLPDQTKVTILYLFDTWVRFDKISWDFRGYLAGYLNFLFFHTHQYQKFVEWGSSWKNQSLWWKVDIRNDSLDTIAKEIIEISPYLENSLHTNFMTKYLWDLDTKTKVLYESMFQPKLTDIKNSIRQEVEKIQQAKSDDYLKSNILFN